MNITRSATIARTVASLGAAAVVGAGLVGIAGNASATQYTVPIVTNLRAAGHSGYDRVVIDYTAKSYGAKPSLKVRWVNKAYQCGSGQRVKLPGDRILTVTLNPAQAHTDEGKDAYVGPGQTSTALLGLKTAKSVRMICDFEGYVSFAIGTKGATGFSTGSLSSPKRFYVDIAR